MLNAPITPSLRLVEGDINLTVPELLKAVEEIKFALETDPPETHKVGLLELLAIAEDLLKSKLN
jgi:hypothetical protein